MNRNINRILVGLIIVCLVLSAFQNEALFEARSNRVGDMTGIAHSAPLVTFVTVVLGGFRGLIADILWLRATSLQDEARYFELAQLAEWITRLEPSCTQIWAYHAWNMSYNVSVMMSDREDKWRWVNNGLTLLRDKGIPANPRDPRIYCELGWLYQHKIGKNMDEAHLAYKMQLAEEVQSVLPGGVPDYRILDGDAATAGRIRETLALDVNAMKRIDSLYGPLDWRLPETHAIYWAYLGKQHANDLSEHLPADRMIYQSLARSFFLGRIASDDQALLRAPRWNLMNNVKTAFGKSIDTHKDDENILKAYAGFLTSAVVVLDSYGREAEARAAFQDLRTLASSGEPSSDFEAFVTNDGVRRSRPRYIRRLISSLPGKETE